MVVVRAGASQRAKLCSRFALLVGLRDNAGMDSNTPTPTPRKARPRWLRYPLRGLLVLVLLVSIPMAWIANRVNALRPQLEAANRIVERGGAVRYEPAKPEWITRIVGVDSFRRVRSVGLANGAGGVRQGLQVREHNQNSYEQHLRDARRAGNQRAIAALEKRFVESNAWLENWESLYEKEFPSDTFPRSIGDADLTDLRFLENLRELYVDTAGISDDALVHLALLTKLESVDLSSTFVTGDGMKHLSHLLELRRLFLRRLDLDDESLAPLHGLTNLEWLFLNGNERLTGEGLVHLSGSQDLNFLQLYETGMTDVGLAEIGKFHALETLNVGQTKITNAGLEHLGNLSNLESLYIGNTKVTDAGLPHLGGLSKLESLYMRDTKVTDAGLECLASLGNLRDLDLRGTRVTGAGIAKLKAALPNAKIRRF